MNILPSILSFIALFSCGNNDIQWNGVSHVVWQDCRPRVPIDGGAFAVRLHTYQLDICTVRVNVQTDTAQWIDAVYVEDRGPYAVWEAQIPATAHPTVSYWFELTDGSDIDFYGPGGMTETPPAAGFLIDFDTYAHVQPGVHPLDQGGAIFKVWAPTATQAWVRGQFNNWTTSNPMTKYGAYFVAIVPNAVAGQQYKYFFNPNAIWKPDPRAKSLDGVSGYNSFVVDPDSYVWQTTEATTVNIDDAIVYQLHVGTFAGRNDPVASGAIPAKYTDVAAHADHLAELGVTVVQLCPINEFPFDFSGGYNPISAWALERKLGTPAEFKQMVDALHGVGIAVTLDIVWNHFSPSDNFLWQYDGGHIYFDNPPVDTPWGAQLDFNRVEVREYLLHSAMNWLDEFRLDGFRLDGADYMNQGAHEADGWALMQALNNTIDNRWIDKIAIAEQLPNDPWVTRPTSLGGAGFDAQYHDNFNDRLREAILAAAFGDPSMNNIKNIINGGGQYLEGNKVLNYLELHDEAWPSSGGQRLVRTIDTTFPHDDQWAKGRVKLGQGVVFTAPGIPAILQGSEWLEDTDFGGGNAAGGDRIDWSKKTTYADILLYFKDLIRVRKLNDALKASSPRNVYHVNESGNVIAWHRWTNGGNNVVMIANFSNTDYAVYDLGLPLGGEWYELINSQAAEYGGSGQGNGGKVVANGPALHGMAQSATLVLPKMAFLVLRAGQPPCPDADSDGDVDDSDLGLTLNGFGLCSGAPAYNYDTDFNRDGCTNDADLGLLLNAFGGPCTY